MDEDPRYRSEHEESPLLLGIPRQDEVSDELTDEEDPVKVEKVMNELIEKPEWTMFSHRLIFHGRRICHSRRAACGACMLAADCPSFGLEGPSDPFEAQKLIKSDDREHLLKMAGM